LFIFVIITVTKKLFKFLTISTCTSWVTHIICLDCYFSEFL